MQDIPDEKKCRQLMTQYVMLPNIIQHSYRVCQVALFLSRALNQTGAGLNLELIKAASLLHDITKTRGLQTKENHAKTGEALLTDLGYPQVARVVGRHVELKDVKNCSSLTEEHIVNHADRRVLHENVVSLEVRFSYLIDRYGRTPEIRRRINMMEVTARELERVIFHQINYSPDELLSLNDLPPSEWNLLPEALSPQPPIDKRGNNGLEKSRNKLEVRSQKSGARRKKRNSLND